jgi:hypothetical protein
MEAEEKAPLFLEIVPEGSHPSYAPYKVFLTNLGKYGCLVRKIYVLIADQSCEQINNYPGSARVLLKDKPILPGERREVYEAASIQQLIGGGDGASEFWSSVESQGRFFYQVVYTHGVRPEKVFCGFFCIWLEEEKRNIASTWYVKKVSFERLQSFSEKVSQ